MKQRFYSKKGTGLAIAFFAITILLLAIAFSVFFGYIPPPRHLVAKIWVFLLPFSVATFLMSMWYYTWYEIDGDTLTCRSGPIFKKIPISAIRSLSKPRKFIFKQSFMAFALSHIQSVVTYNKYDDISISPEDFDGLILALKAINPDINVVD